MLHGYTSIRLMRKLRLVPMPVPLPCRPEPRTYPPSPASVHSVIRQQTPSDNLATTQEIGAKHRSAAYKLPVLVVVATVSWHRRLESMTPRQQITRSPILIPSHHPIMVISTHCHSFSQRPHRGTGFPFRSTGPGGNKTNNVMTPDPSGLLVQSMSAQEYSILLALLLLILPR